ncbi:uncharacterized protein TRUGW13939_00979 [Talaromyces rugulosus]|uniref:Zn(2)-C6 fungal-type domain-containing protein n=1 Tax=Talaromyces rugulosus TaxID=121627 RepID=A0A7H8QIX3_TALRU|nr:uncharacterized protein TRUGW13939_00979 [Talaromyces rugulosus]QKX53899.1 hypothetical protein TRUGW13939_00979 [Talaromyces rugulosus]
MPRRRRDRTFTCDEQRPHCRACQRLGHLCDGYGAKLVWIEDKDQPYRSDGRRYIDCDATWADHAILDSELVDQLIYGCDPECAEEVFNSSSTQPTFNPFGSFRALVNNADHPPGLLSNAYKLLTIDPTDPSSSSSEARFLFHHYTNHVSTMMIPLFHPRNPWYSYYPAVARCYETSEQRALYNAMLSHAAYNLAGLASLPDKMVLLATEYYTNAIEQLKSSLRRQNPDYGGTLAAVMTLCMAEVYSGRPGTWRLHLSGAWSLLREYSKKEPWTDSDFACCSTQSLCITKIIADTGKGHKGTAGIDDSWTRIPFLDWQPFGSLGNSSTSIMDDDEAERSLISRVSSTPGFGFTIGSTDSLLACISVITIAGKKMRAKSSHTQQQADFIDEILSKVFSCLDKCKEETTYNIRDPFDELHDIKSQILANHQREAFISATYIYLYRVLFDLPPYSVRKYVSEVLLRISAFHSESDGNLSIWPAFIAAVEVYTPEDIALARNWLDRTIMFGIGSRVCVRRLVEEIWKRRDEAADELEIDKGLISIDWRAVMEELGMDILLV